MAILCVYLPRYSITCFGPPNGRLAYTTQFLVKRFSINDLSLIPLCLNRATYFARYTLLSAFAGNKYFPFGVMVLKYPFASTPAPGTMQCRCACLPAKAGMQAKGLPPSMENTDHSSLQSFIACKLMNCFPCSFK